MRDDLKYCAKSWRVNDRWRYSFFSHLSLFCVSTQRVLRTFSEFTSTERPHRVTDLSILHLIEGEEKQQASAVDRFNVY